MNHQTLRLRSSANSSVIPFLLGVTTSMSLMWVWKSWKYTPEKTNEEKTRASSSTLESSSSNEGEIFDHENLSHRMLRKAEAVIQWRCGRLILVVERCTNDHNYSAILRTAEALGIATVYTIDPPNISTTEDDENERKFDQKQNKVSRTQEELEIQRMHHIFAQNATEWISIRDFSNSEDCVAHCREEGYKIWATDLSQEAEPIELYANTHDPIEVPDKVALVFGTEAVGVSNYMLEQADKRIYLPLRGFADSLNLSVSTALIIQAFFFLDPSLIGSMNESDKMDLRRNWFTKLAQQRLLTSRQKRERKQLAVKIKRCETLRNRVQEDPTYHIQEGEKKKLAELSSYKQKLEQIDALVDPCKVQSAIQEWIDHPPEPLTDLRRADSHRVCFVGKNTKDMHKDHWKDMVAVSNKGSVVGATAFDFRQKMETVVGDGTNYLV